MPKTIEEAFELSVEAAKKLHDTKVVTTVVNTPRERRPLGLYS
jgi:hypothetical protein